MVHRSMREFTAAMAVVAALAVLACLQASMAFKEGDFKVPRRMDREHIAYTFS